ncbi:rCG60693, isoform CRA_a [Rattus norvegicus]|uniref:RCG60693, isoform CRA_a n=1 Tax=Rattus norvegicus TaxID=10116 RepID=A6JJK8_RAT|nr:rCG60693, isoform CRA_a [Rattus norvegicus]
MHGNSGDWAICCGSRNTRGAEQTQESLSWGSGGGLRPDGEQPLPPTPPFSSWASM